MSISRGSARLVPPGRIIARELEARGWQQKDLAEIMGRPEQAISEILNDKKQITPETARELAGAFGTSIDFWINLETNYRLHLAEHIAQGNGIRREAAH
ncbi:MAG: HigA family addiction module antitoxin [Anaerolineae bacterium]